MQVQNYYNRTGARIKKVLFRTLSLLIIGLGLFSCAKYSVQKKGVWHTLKSGETLESIASQYSVPVSDIKSQNDIYDPEDLSPGISIYIPIPERIQVPPPPEERVPKQTQVRTRFAWPSQGTISSGFGLRHGKLHEGIDITKDKGRDIRAAGSGYIEFAGNKNGYGQTIVINHGGSFKTLYAHNSKLYVKKGMKVSSGVIISRMGSSGKSSGIHLHFEVLYRGKPQNPLRYLPVR